LIPAYARTSFLCRVIADRIDTRPPFSAPFTLWLSTIVVVGLASDEVVVHRALGRKILRQLAPLAAGRQHIEDGVQDLAPAGVALRRKVRLDQRPFLAAPQQAPYPAQ